MGQTRPDAQRLAQANCTPTTYGNNAVSAMLPDLGQSFLGDMSWSVHGRLCEDASYSGANDVSCRCRQVTLLWRGEDRRRSNTKFFQHREQRSLQRALAKSYFVRAADIVERIHHNSCDQEQRTAVVIYALQSWYC